MSVEFLLRGMLVGFLIAAPVGPIGVLTIRRTLARGWSTGLATGLGAASADAIYGAVAAFGLTLITAALVGQRMWLQIIGGGFLLVLGLRTMLAPPAEQGEGSKTAGLLRSYLSSFALTLTNPTTILSFIAVFAGAGLVASSAGYGDAIAMVAGVFMGSAAWWLLLCSAVGAMRHRLSPRALAWINRLSGAVLACFGVWSLVAAAMG
jgi:threonine/homoserine/homoserine lactone efflux protein